ncbi:hypothetical protein ISN44_As11g031750 [Arabidopsis suecica]|uniref:Retrotransposon gag domain-containing protein n=1 Tax=Arabidopsis suecica TaxID=45249 RepID=A0A8T1ZGS2_ARASU|nr:hypothetical protein ISN44_As11g031750 [Arabidopsis suecica]
MVTSNKDRLDLLKVRLADVQEELVKMHVGFNKKVAQIEASLKQLIETMTTQAMFQTKFTNLEFPKFSTGDPTTCLSMANQFFAYQDIPEDHLRVQLGSYHLEDEAYQWWLAMTKTIKEDNTVITWNVFEEEMLVRFGSTEDLLYARLNKRVASKTIY